MHMVYNNTQAVVCCCYERCETGMSSMKKT